MIMNSYLHIRIFICTENMCLKDLGPFLSYGTKGSIKVKPRNTTKQIDYIA